eukprot:TRINITY_DN11742_c0_g1_i2.p3 TRINITY_DN11742_c0_g1~~TRINITY_DN11742_c0_g1_i2.p3  ORF type:complete len:105 (+),score=25.69 TRINITY_DN11742_c0_g1_i2:87-401(+)
MLAVSVPRAMAPTGSRARPLAKPVWKPTSTVRYMWYPHRALSTNYTRVNGILCRRGLTKVLARTGTNFNASYGISSGIQDTMIMGMVKHVMPSQGWTYIGSKDN